jgi:cardiolipin synthase (CMP-forming)
MATLANIMWRYLPNAISMTRLAATPILLFSAITGSAGLFKWLLLACLLSDILDGLLARTFHWESPFGASLDSTADMLVALIAPYGVYVFQWGVLRPHWPPLAAMVGLNLIQMASAFWRYGRISSFHTLLIRIAAYVQGAFAMSLFLWGFQTWLFYLMVPVSLLAYGEELILVWMLPEWQANVGGLYRVLKQQALLKQTMKPHIMKPQIMKPQEAHD